MPAPALPHNVTCAIGTQLNRTGFVNCALQWDTLGAAATVANSNREIILPGVDEYEVVVFETPKK